MNCEEVKSFLESFHDKSVDLRLEKRIREHLIVCSACGIKLSCLRNLSELLQKSRIPAASSALDEKIKAAFAQEYKPFMKPASWWQKVFTGSISIPKPVLAASLILIAAAVIGANLLGRNSAVISSDDGGPSPVAEQFSINPARGAAETSAAAIAPERFQVVEIPVVKERVVTKIVYVEQQQSSGPFERAAGRSANSNQTRAEDKRQIPAADSKTETGLKMSSAIADNGYFTRADLTDFQPATEPRIKIIRGDKINEK